MNDKNRAGLEDVVVTSSSICYLNEKRNTVEVRGYDLLDLAEQSNFEEVCYLLSYGRLPRASELDRFSQAMINGRELPTGMVDLIRLLPKVSTMDALRTWISALAAYDHDQSNTTLEGNFKKALRVTAIMPTITTVAFRLSQGQEIIPPDPKLNHAENFLYMILGRRVNSSLSRAFEKSMILYSEHELNASTFSARVTSSTLSDIYSSITSAIGTLKGPLHGGANEEAMKLLLSIKEPELAEQSIRTLLTEKKRVMGFGHRIYKAGDPRVKLMKRLSRQIGEETGQLKWHEICERVETVVAAQKGLHPNLDFYSAPAYYALGIPIDLYTPIFASSRAAGWSAHVLEQLENNRLIRPRAEYTGPADLTYLPIEERK